LAIFPEAYAAALKDGGLNFLSMPGAYYTGEQKAVKSTRANSPTLSLL